MLLLTESEGHGYVYSALTSPPTPAVGVLLYGGGPGGCDVELGRNKKPAAVQAIPLVRWEVPFGSCGLHLLSV